MHLARRAWLYLPRHSADGPEGDWKTEEWSLPGWPKVQETARITMIDEGEDRGTMPPGFCWSLLYKAGGRGTARNVAVLSLLQQRFQRHPQAARNQLTGFGL